MSYLHADDLLADTYNLGSVPLPLPPCSLSSSDPLLTSSFGLPSNQELEPSTLVGYLGPELDSFNCGNLNPASTGFLRAPTSNTSRASSDSSSQQNNQWSSDEEMSDLSAHSPMIGRLDDGVHYYTHHSSANVSMDATASLAQQALTEHAMQIDDDTMMADTPHTLKVEPVSPSMSSVPSVHPSVNPSTETNFVGSVSPTPSDDTNGSTVAKRVAKRNKKSAPESCKTSPKKRLGFKAKAQALRAQRKKAAESEDGSEADVPNTKQGKNARSAKMYRQRKKQYVAELEQANMELEETKVELENELKDKNKQIADLQRKLQEVLMGMLPGNARRPGVMYAMFAMMLLVPFALLATTGGYFAAPSNMAPSANSNSFAPVGFSTRRMLDTETPEYAVVSSMGEATLSTFTVSADGAASLNTSLSSKHAFGVSVEDVATLVVVSA